MLQLLLYMCGERKGWEWGEAGDWMPLPTRPQRYCDFALLVFLQVRAISGECRPKVPLNYGNLLSIGKVIQHKRFITIDFILKASSPLNINRGRS